MIRISIYRRNQEYEKVTASGHAEFDEKGKDIVCAAVSVLIINTANSLEKLTDDLEYAGTSKDGITELILKNPVGEKGTLLLDSMCLGLEEIQKQYGKKYLRIDYKEV